MSKCVGSSRIRRAKRKASAETKRAVAVGRRCNVMYLLHPSPGDNTT